jgi:drug/metabolite transporter (DMT)-like permease
MIYYILLFIVQILFGVNFVASKVVVTSWSPFAFASLRFMVSGVVILLALKVLGKSITLKKEYWKNTLILAFIGFSFSQSCFLYGLSMTTSTNTALISSTIPLFIFLINRFRGVGSWSKTKLIGLMISFIGVLVLRKIETFSLSDSGMWGDLLVLGACSSLAVMISFSSDYFQKVDPIIGSAHMFWVGGLFLLPLWFMDGFSFPVNASASFYGSLLFSIIGATCLTYLFNNIALKRVDSDVVGLFIFLQPIVAAIFALVTMNTQIEMRSLGAFILILIGVNLVIKKPKVIS